MIRLTAHARDMIAVRGIDWSWIEETLASPERVTVDPANPLLRRAFKRLDAADGRSLRLVYRDEGPDIVVVTCFLDRGARR